MYNKKYHIHFVGIGGIGMSGIAELLINLGYRISGSDIKSTEITKNLKNLGARIYQGHNESHIKDADVVVISSAVNTDNKEVVAALSKSIPVIPRAEMLAELMRLKFSIAVAGAHGKTSTTSIVASILASGGLDPTVVIGGKIKSLNTNALLGQGDFIVAEADESDGSFLKYSPTIVVVTNIDSEHLDYYKDIHEIKDVFLKFINRIPFYGCAVLCLDNESIQDLIPRIKKRFITYGLNIQADVQAREIVYKGLKTYFAVYYLGKKIGDIELNLPGIHNVQNALSSIAIGIELNISFDLIANSLKNVEGVHRRFEIIGEVNGITIIDDYGHHPTEIKTTLDTIKSIWPKRRKVIVFQPHRYTRTHALFNDFSRAFYQSDELILLPVYSAGEDVIQGADSYALHENIKKHGHKKVIYKNDLNQTVDYLKENLTGGDVLITLGAGNVWEVGKKILEVFKGTSPVL